MGGACDEREGHLCLMGAPGCTLRVFELELRVWGVRGAAGCVSVGGLRAMGCRLVWVLGAAGCALEGTGCLRG